MTDRPDSDPESQQLDPQLLEFARRFDPARHLPDGPPVTAEQIRRKAERREEFDREWKANPLSRPLRHSWVAAVCVAAILIVSVLGVAVLRPHLSPTVAESQSASGSAPPPGPARPALLEIPAPQGNVRTARDALNNLADRAAKQPPATPAMFIYVRRQAWTFGGSPDAVIATDIQTWLRADRSAFEQSTTLPPQTAGERLAQWTQQLPAQIQATLQTYEPGGYPHPIPAPAAQAGLLAPQISNAYSYHIAAGVAELFRLGLTPVQREAAIQVLAGINNLAYHGMVKDRASRTGIAITSTDPGTGVREVLIFHPDTGELLDHEKWVSGPGGETFVDAYVLYLDIHSTNTRP
jgi:hypothetical protein